MNMLINAQKQDCPRADDIVAYIYNEIDDLAKESFEQHLPECISCTDEFALVSDARFSVFEWNKEEFVPLATPEFSIPYREAKGSPIRVVTSWLSGLKGFGWPAAAAASFAIVVGAAFGMLWLSPSDDQIARVEVTPVSVPTANRIATIEVPEDTSSESSIDVGPAAPVVVREEPRSRPDVSRTVKRTPESKPARTKRPERKPVPDNAPMLSNYEDTEDRSLRLADLLDEIGG